MIYIVVSVSLVQCVLLPVHCASLGWSGSRVCAAEYCDVYVSYGTTSEAIGHVSTRSATSIKGNGRHVVKRRICSILSLIQIGTLDEGNKERSRNITSNGIDVTVKDRLLGSVTRKQSMKTSVTVAM